MGQPIEVTSQPGSRPGLMIFSINRSVTGMKLEEYPDPTNAEGDRWCDELARRLGAAGVTRATIYSSTIVAEAPDWEARRGEAEQLIRDLYIYYVDGKIPEGDYTGEPESSSDEGSEEGSEGSEEEKAAAESG